MTCHGLCRGFAARALSVLALALMSIAPAAGGEPLRLRILGGPEASPSAVPGVEIVRGDGSADLIWDGAEGFVYTGAGEIAAENIKAAGLAAVAGKWSAARRLTRAAGTPPLALETLPPRTHRTFGETFRLRSEVLPHPYLLVLNLAADGAVQLLYPLASEAHAVSPGSRYELPLRAGPPAGVDHVVVVNTAAPLDALIPALEGRNPGEAAGAIIAALARAPHRIGILTLFSAPKS